MICTGNICRSPMAEVVLAHLVASDDVLRGRVEVTSAGTANWHVGRPMDPRARRALDRAGLDREASLGAYADRDYLNGHDVVVVMTLEHLHDVRHRLTNQATKVILLRNLISPGFNLDVADPYYGSDQDFDECLELLSECGRLLTSVLRQRLREGPYEA
jgi:protein-tyrosine phosphatase